MIDEFGDDLPTMYGAWCVLTSIAALCPVRGLLANTKGQPLSVAHMARTAFFPSPVLEKLIAWAARPDVGWLVVVEPEEVARLLGESPDFPRENDTSGESPDGIPLRQDNPPHTRPNRTQPNPTGHNPTPPDITQQVPGGRSDDWAGRWRNLEKGFFEEVVEVANRFSKVSLAKVIDRDTLWRVCWIGVQFDRSTVDDCIERFKEKTGIKKPKHYVIGAMIRLCERNGEDWDNLKLLVPPPPPLQKRTPTTLDSELNLIAG